MMWPTLKFVGIFDFLIILFYSVNILVVTDPNKEDSYQHL